MSVANPFVRRIDEKYERALEFIERRAEARQRRSRVAVEDLPTPLRIDELPEPPGDEYFMRVGSPDEPPVEVEPPVELHVEHDEPRVEHDEPRDEVHVEAPSTWIPPVASRAPRAGAPEQSDLIVVDAAGLLSAELPERETLLEPWLQSQSLCMLYAWRGIGKTHAALGIAYAIASGGAFLKWRAPVAVPTLFLDGEMPGPALRDRLAAIVASADREPPPGCLRFVTPDLQRGPMPDLATREGQERIEKVIGDAKVIIVDNLSCLVRGARENESDDWRPVADWALRQRARGRSVLLIHHAAKGGQQRGTSRREDLLDVVIVLRRPSDYRPEQGARFVVAFEKFRNHGGDEIKSFEAALETDATGRQVWTVRDCEDAIDDQVIELAKLGLKQADIARELNVHRSTILRTLRRAEEQGRYLPKGGRHG
jgi:hypothetical protein